MADTNLISVEDRQDFIEGVYSGKYGPGVIPPAIYLGTANILMEEVFNGFGRSFFDETIAQGDLDWLKSTHENVYLFSGCKTQRQALDLQKAAVDPDGFLRPFRDYKKAALEIDRAYNLNWLATEMRTAFALSQSASQWKDIERVKGVFSHLRYITKEDDHVRQSHRPLNDIVRPVDDPFWDTHFPPVDWNCRCTFEQLRKSEVPKRVGRIDKTVNEVPSPLFRFNPGKKGIVFDKSHPYFEEVLAKYPYLKQITPPPPPPPPTQRVVPDPPAQDVPGPPMSPQLFKTIKEELGDEFKDFDQRAIQLASVEREPGRLKISFVDPTGEGSYYHPFKREVVISKKTRTGQLRKRWKNSKSYRPRVVYHELGHSIHSELKIIAPGMERSDWKEMFIKHENSVNGRTNAGKARRRELDKKLHELNRLSWDVRMDGLDLWTELDNRGFSDLAKKLPKDTNHHDLSELVGALADSLGSLTKGSVGWGHSKAYYKTSNFRHMEHFAHSCENFFGGNPVYEYLAPDWYQDTKDFIGKLLKENNIPSA